MAQQSKPSQATTPAQNMNTNKGKENTTSRELEDDIHETREAISTDIRELSDKFSPAHLKEEAKSAVASVANTAAEKATEVKDVIVDKAVEIKDTAAEKMHEAKDVVVDTMEDVGEQARRIGTQAWEYTAANAVPLALIGLGAGLLIANTRRSRPSYGGRELASQYDEPRRAASTQRDGRPRAAARAVHHIGEGARDLAGSAGDNAQKLKARASRSAQSVKDGISRAGVATRNFAEENPLAIAIGALVAGVGVGLALPATDPERRLLGPTHAKFDRFVGDARTAASDVANAAKDTANESVRALT